MLKRITPTEPLLLKERQEKILTVLEIARNFDFQQKTPADIKELHKLLCEAVELCESSSLNNRFTLAELKSRRLACACRLEVRGF